MNTGLRICTALLIAVGLSFGTAQASSYFDQDCPQEVEEIPDGEIPYDSTNADEWFFDPSDGAKGTYIEGADGEGSYEKRRKSDEKDRFEWIFTDGSYEYYMDRKNTKWVRVPYSASEYMIDVWIRLVSMSDDAIVEEYDNNGRIIGRYRKYYLEHYYVRPQTQQIQFLCELEVTGRPQNTISEREYSVRNWENLIPGSIEDEVYHAVVKRMGKKGSSSKGRMGVFDMLDEYGRIAL